MTSKQRAYLRGLANTMEPIIHVGKDGVNENMVKQASDALEARELIKGTVLQNSRRKCLLMPGAKIGADSFIKVCDMDAFDLLITDWDCVEEQLAAIEEKGVEVIVVEKLE